jgi:hypothetical protein
LCSFIVDVFSAYKTIVIRSCTCEIFPQVLVCNGLFPASPSEPHVCFSIGLLSFYAALFKKSSDAIVAFVAASKNFHDQCGFLMVDNKVHTWICYILTITSEEILQGQPFCDHFWRGFLMAARWFDALWASVSRGIDDAIKAVSLRIQQHKGLQANVMDESAWELWIHCPACFGGAAFGKSFNRCFQSFYICQKLTFLCSGGDIHVCCDGNFHHWHRWSAGDTPSLYNSLFLIPKEYVDQVGRHISHLRPQRSPQQASLPTLNSAVDECEWAYTAADGSKIKTNGEVFDDTGLMALVCCHDIPILFANIDTPGEQQKFAVALVIWLFSLLPSNATVTVLYDVGCVLACSMNLSPGGHL